MMTKKDYVRAAEMIRAEVNPKFAKAVCETFATFFSRDNPNFDVERFRAACETGLVTRDRKSFDKRNMPSGPMGNMKPVK